ncbi:protein yellow-like [Belonocnema kinseyi]|uniref:protein yellow-like n=1 Tax=Belonocnema kinseyi TaxID=2817044 RepID=UPI00143E0C13|nr:protein yellow-like [Belonocnema kinseyi]
MLVQLVLLVTINLVQANQNYRVIYQWNIIEPEWPNQEDRETSLANGSYIPENNPITGIKLWKDNLYLTVPRWRNGVPATLTVISAIPDQTLVNTQHGNQNLNVVNPKLKPFPNWQMQTIGDCKSFQFVQSMEIDPLGRMWVIDTGRIDIQTENPKNLCPPRLVILDLETGGTVLRNYVFPTDVADYKSAFLNDIVLDHEHGGFAYITDAGKKDPGLIVYSLATNTSWKVRHGTMWAEDEAKSLTVNDVKKNLTVNIDGIALSPSSRYDRMVYYTPLTSFNLYSIPTAILKTGLSNVSDFIRKIGRRGSQTDGMMMTSTGTLFFGLLANNSVAYWRTPQIFEQSSGQDSVLKVDENILSRDDNLLQWPDTFAIDEEGYLWCVTNALQNFSTKNFNPNSTNYRVIKFMTTRARSYQYFQDGSAPILPILSPLENSSSVYEIPVSLSISDDSFPTIGRHF